MQLQKTNFLILCGCFSMIFVPVWSFANAAAPTNATESPFIGVLKIGMSGENVRTLQKVLNQDNETKVASFGAGSSGQESNYFGILTHNAVIRFQEKYKDEILTPNGLSSGTGFVGPSTIKVISKIIAGKSVGSVMDTPVKVATMTSSISNKTVKTGITGVTSGVTTGSATKFATNNPNLVNFDTFVSTVEKVSKKYGVSEENITKIKNQLLINAATTTDLKKEFIKLVESGKKESGKDPSFQSGASRFPLFIAVNNFFGSVKDLVVPKKALAVLDSPFGGAILYSTYCTCGDNWLITIEPMAPTYVALLTYTVGSQAYLNYNIPFNTWLLGKYTQSGTCSMYTGESCTDIYAEGDITPTVGSDLR